MSSANKQTDAELFGTLHVQLKNEQSDDDANSNSVRKRYGYTYGVLNPSSEVNSRMTTARPSSTPLTASLSLQPMQNRVLL